MLTKEQIRARGTKVVRRYCTVPLDDGSEIRIQSLLKSEKRTWRQSTQKKDGTVDPKKQEHSDDVLLALTIVDDAGATVYTVDEALNGIFDLWDTSDLTKLAEVAAWHTGVYVDRKDVEAILKNSKTTPGSDSSGVNANISE